MLKGAQFQSAANILALWTPCVAIAAKISLMVGDYKKYVCLPAKRTEVRGHFKDEGVAAELLNEGRLSCR